MTLSDATTPGQSWHGSDDNKWVLHIPQRSSITGASPLDCLVSYTGGVLPYWRDAVGVFYSSRCLGQWENDEVVGREHPGIDKPAMHLWPYCLWKHLWGNSYCCGKWARRHELKSWMRLFAYHVPLERH